MCLGTPPAREISRHVGRGARRRWGVGKGNQLPTRQTRATKRRPDCNKNARHASERWSRTGVVFPRAARHGIVVTKTSLAPPEALLPC
jgi:hypothetical protein